MDERAKISVIVPVYNVEKYLNRCVDSILAQTFTDFECILIDDGSTDGSGKICDEYAAKDSRIKVIHKANGGVSAARNRGIDLSVGRYLCFVDADDYLETDYCAELVSLIEKNSHSWCFCGCNVVDANSRISKPDCVLHAGEKYEVFELSNYDEVYRKNFSACLWLRIFNSDIVKKNGVRFDENMSKSEDVLFCLHYGKYCDKFSVVNLPLYNHRMYYFDEQEHLDHRKVDNMLYIDRQVYNARKIFISRDRLVDFSTDFFYRFIAGIKDVCADSSYDEKNKKQIIKNVVSSKEFIECMSFADTSKESSKLLALLS